MHDQPCSVDVGGRILTRPKCTTAPLSPASLVPFNPPSWDPDIVLILLPPIPAELFPLPVIFYGFEVTTTTITH
ncbi:hypothetical protein L227DRAFT_405932 [Lentinus tigrinus ALCF2SS1-6]|uniref:Uncharacterized protein n=1 Tax=Lentinus tigrinus ALCF2SS1-6 TaxID=1328759 RepID=A0A5C2RRL3_9APHY|nr:hypothetical protein L227DRAFT_405932 [Lentinus tigrinus ALCF2SS1-6]